MARIERLTSLKGATVYAVKLNGIVQSLHASQKDAVRAMIDINTLMVVR